MSAGLVYVTYQNHSTSAFSSVTGLSFVWIVICVYFCLTHSFGMASYASSFTHSEMISESGNE